MFSFPPFSAVLGTENIYFLVLRTTNTSVVCPRRQSFLVLIVLLVLKMRNGGTFQYTLFDIQSGPSIA